MNIVELYGIEKSYKKIKALKNISLSIPKQKLTCIVGPDGAGKSTLLKIMAGVLKSDAGKIVLDGRHIGRIDEMEKYKDFIAFMPQGLGLNLYQNLTIEENIDFFADLHGLDHSLRERRKELLLKATNLLKFKDREVSKLSGGMKQKLGICCSLIHSPKLMILDEPTTGVDPVSRKELYLLIHRFIEEEGVSVVVSTSYMDEAERGDKILILNEGELILDNYQFEEEMEVYELKNDDYMTVYNNMDPQEYHFIKLLRNGIRFCPKYKDERGQKAYLRLEDRLLKVIGTRKLNLNIAEKAQLSEKIINVENVSKRFGDFYAVKDLSIDIYEGEIFGLLGPNGAGKTTLIKMILNLYEPSSGIIRTNIEPSMIRSHLGYMSQKFSLYSDLTVKENLMFYGSAHNMPLSEIKNKIRELLSICNLELYEQDIVEALPLGIKQRLALACAIIHEPKLLFLDEPTSGVSVAERDVFWQIIRYLSNTKHTTVLVSTHYMDEADYCDRLCMMHEGRVALIGTPDELKGVLKNKLGEPYLLEVDNPYTTYSMLKAEGYRVDIFGNRIKIFLRTIEDVHGVSFKAVQKSEITIEDVFASVTEHAI